MPETTPKTMEGRLQQRQKQTSKNGALNYEARCTKQHQKHSTPKTMECSLYYKARGMTETNQNERGMRDRTG